MSKKKKIIVLSCMIALLVATAVLNFALSTKKAPENDSVSTANYFSEYRTQRTSLRNEQILQLNQIISESEDNSEVKNNALSQKLQLTALMEEEFKLESLIKTRGYEDVVVKINQDTSKVNVILGQEYKIEDASKIYFIINEEMNIPSENVTIMNI